MESAYTLANRELEEIRMGNRAMEAARREEVLTKAPELRKIENALSEGGTRLLNCVLKRGEGFEEIKESIRALRRKKEEMLAQNGFSTDYLDEIYACRECSDTGFVDGKRCECLKKLIKKHIGANSNLTEQLRAQTFDNFDMTLFKRQADPMSEKAMRSAYRKCEEFAESFETDGKNILLMGNAGTGKTFLSSCVANRALERGKSVYYQTAYRLFETIEKSRFDKEADEDVLETVKYLYDVDLLIIDDLGTEFTTQFTIAAFFELLNARILDKKSTVISTNLDFDNISKIYSQRIASRFIGDYILMTTVSEDLRAARWK